MPNTGRPSRDCHLCRKRRVKVGDIPPFLLFIHTTDLYGGMMFCPAHPVVGLQLFIPAMPLEQPLVSFPIMLAFSTPDLLHVPVLTCSYGIV